MYLEPKPSNGLSNFLDQWNEEFNPAVLSCNMIDVIVGNLDRAAIGPTLEHRRYFVDTQVERELQLKIGLERLNLNGKEYRTIFPSQKGKHDLVGTRRWHDKGISIR